MLKLQKNRGNKMEKMEFAKLNAKTISEQEFPVEFKGYKVEEVDQYLDRVVDDYNFFETAIERYERDNKSLKFELDDLRELLHKKEEILAEFTDRLRKLGGEAEANKNIMNRINELERRVEKK
ncbi:hypothetical protein Zmor_008762 [Zophobas morio]|jgi:cell division initiation protein|uniref:DivIVA domain-containing protein n=1 Tax=Zophobas morio TaxID=2755281 RepID=A0AA38HIS3_9CUCU|nr:hypothetical protein Zmor_008762 [Zophobas morio]